MPPLPAPTAAAVLLPVVVSGSTTTHRHHGSPLSSASSSQLSSLPRRNLQRPWWRTTSHGCILCISLGWMITTTSIRLNLHLGEESGSTTPTLTDIFNQNPVGRALDVSLPDQLLLVDPKIRDLERFLPTIHVDRDEVPSHPHHSVSIHRHHGTNTTITTTTTAAATTTIGRPLFVVQPHDFVYEFQPDRWDSAPIVLERYKLIFFTTPKVACTTFKQLFRRMMQRPDWNSQDPIRGLPHNPKFNGLVYLWNYSIHEANAIMTSPDYTRAIFVRDPKSRFLSAFLEKGVGNFDSFIQDNCCPTTKDCAESAKTSEGFFDLIQNCSDPHWDPQNRRMEPKYWPYINFVGHLEQIAHDGPALLQRIGAWEEYGRYGWGRNGNSTLFSSSSSQNQNHATKSSDKVWQWLTPSLERKIESFYEADYQNPLFQFEMMNLTKDFWIKGHDTIFAKGPWDGAPVVVEQYKLIFFTMPRIGAQVWKQAFRRMEGLSNWDSTSHGLPHDPTINGLRYLYDYHVEDAEKMIRDPTWTKAIFIRHPTDRFLDIYLHMSTNPSELRRHCCPTTAISNAMDDCTNHLNAESLIHFLTIASRCNSDQWQPQTNRMEDRYWEHVNFIGRMESVQDDAKKLLERIGAWNDIGATGWGPQGDEPIFRSSPPGETTMVTSTTSAAATAVANLVDTERADQMLEELYKADFDNEKFHFHRNLSLVVLVE